MRNIIIIVLVLAIVGVIAYFLLRKPKTVSMPQVQPDGTITTVQVPAPTPEVIASTKAATRGKG
jgi:hypothetical protein